MTIFNFGSINIDHVYQVEHFVRPGETLSSSSYQQYLGGKGANQSIALARAQCHVVHVGAIGKNDEHLLTEMSNSGVNTQKIAQVSEQTGHAIIQINSDAENAIILFSGANQALTTQQIESTLEHANTNDWVLLQNETNQIKEVVISAKKHGLTVAYNPAPMDKALSLSLMTDIDVLIVNEVEAMDLLGVDDIEKAKVLLQHNYPKLRILLTLGSKGVLYIQGEEIIEVAAYRVNAVDTTAAGDTFIGYCLAGMIEQKDIQFVLRQACAASAICVSNHGAISAIPKLPEVIKFVKGNN
jgi:ribokinase